MEDKPKFYETAWFMWLTLFFFAPVGIFLMWKYAKFGKSMTRVIVTISFSAFFIIQVATNAGLINTAKDSSSATLAQSSSDNQASKEEKKKAEAKAKAEAEVKAKAEVEAKAKAEAEVKVKAEAKAKAGAEAKDQAKQAFDNSQAIAPTVRDLLATPNQYFDQKVKIGPLKVIENNLDRNSFYAFVATGPNLADTDYDTQIEIIYSKSNNFEGCKNLASGSRPIIYVSGMLNTYSNNSKKGYIQADEIWISK